MFVKTLTLTNYRNYQKESISLSPSTNILLGNNASGKTNVLEAIYTLAVARSFRAKDKDIINYGNEYYKIKASVENRNREFELILIGSDAGKKIIKDGAEIKKTSDFIGNLNVVLFSPDDMLLFKNGPQEKRNLIDLSLLQVSKQYIEDYSAFKKQLKLRNDYLKYLFPKLKEDEELKDEMLDVLTMNFIDCNKKIYEARLKFLESMEKLTTEKYRNLSGDMVDIKFDYQINFDNKLSFYKDKYKQDINAGSTQYGCHRDNLRFLKDNKDFENSCSQGEQRMLSLSIKLALAEMLKNMKQDPPVVLLDDVFSELDKNHQNRLLRMLDKSMQIVITTTDVLKIGKLALDNSKIFTVNHGTLKETEING